MDVGRPNDVSPEAMQARIQQARREAETLKDRIKRKKDELADTTRESPLARPVALPAARRPPARRCPPRRPASLLLLTPSRV